jgi:hypothetical protein
MGVCKQQPCPASRAGGRGLHNIKARRGAAAQPRAARHAQRAAAVRVPAAARVYSGFERPGCTVGAATVGTAGSSAVWAVAERGHTAVAGGRVQAVWDQRGRVVYSNQPNRTDDELHWDSRRVVSTPGGGLASRTGCGATQHARGGAAPACGRRPCVPRHAHASSGRSLMLHSIATRLSKHRVSNPRLADGRRQASNDSRGRITASVTAGKDRLGRGRPVDTCSCHAQLLLLAAAMVLLFLSAATGAAICTPYAGSCYAAAAPARVAVCPLLGASWQLKGARDWCGFTQAAGRAAAAASGTNATGSA